MGADPRNAAHAGLASRGLTEAQAPGGGGGCGHRRGDSGGRAASMLVRGPEQRQPDSRQAPAPRLDGLHRPRVKPPRLARRPRSTPGPVVALCALRGGMSAFGHDPPTPPHPGSRDPGTFPGTTPPPPGVPQPAALGRPAPCCALTPLLSAPRRVPRPHVGGVLRFGVRVGVAALAA